jgi:iodotyrosine deiodinase
MSDTNAPRSPHPSIPYRAHVPPEGAQAAAKTFCETLARRRSVRHFSERPVSWDVLQWILQAACTAPSGANRQPWRFVAVQDPAIKRKIREAAEAEEREFYSRRATPEWLADLAPLGTDPTKEFLEVAPWVIVVFKLMKNDDGGATYYVNESVGIAVGMLLAAAQLAGLATLTHTPSPMGFLTEVLSRPANERAFLVIPIGYAAENAMVPDITRKPTTETLVVV